MGRPEGLQTGGTMHILADDGRLRVALVIWALVTMVRVVAAIW